MHEHGWWMSWMWLLWLLGAVLFGLFVYVLARVASRRGPRRAEDEPERRRTR